MITFLFINGLRYPRNDFVNILTDLQGNHANASSWYQAGNLTHTLNKAITHHKACLHIHDKPASNVNQQHRQKQPKENQGRKEMKPAPPIIQFKQELTKATNKKRHVTKMDEKKCKMCPTSKYHKSYICNMFYGKKYLQGLQLF